MTAMRYAIFGDIHGNAEALNAVLADIERARVDRCLCLGDVVGYGAEPEKCIAELRSRGIETVLGNHDSAAVGDTPVEYFNEYAKDAVVWTAERLTDDDKEYLKRLPLTGGGEGFTTVHSSLDNPKDWGYIIDLVSARRCFEFLADKLCFIGHSHVPVVFQESSSINCYRASDMAMERDARYIVNVGSVGQPRDGDRRASYAIYDATEMRFEFRRVPYDVRKTQDKIISAGLPRFLALRLGVGR